MQISAAQRPLGPGKHAGCPLLHLTQKGGSKNGVERVLQINLEQSHSLVLQKAWKKLSVCNSRLGGSVFDANPTCSGARWSFTAGRCFRKMICSETRRRTSQQAIGLTSFGPLVFLRGTKLATVTNSDSERCQRSDIRCPCQSAAHESERQCQLRPRHFRTRSPER